MMKKTVCLCLALLLLLPMLLTGCSDEAEKATKGFSTTFGDSRIGSAVVAENERFQLIWKEEGSRQAAFLYDKVTDRYYGNTPYDYFTEQPDNAYADYQLYSPINISYIKKNPDTNMSSIYEIDAKSGSIDYVQYEEVDVLDMDGNPTIGDDGQPVKRKEWPTVIDTVGNEWEKTGVNSELIDNGIRITYSFPEEKIAVALELVLTENGLVASIPMDLIQEDQNLVYEISVLPFFASASHQQEKKEDAYLFIPSGGGALVYAQDLYKKDAEEKKVVVYSEPVYGNDLNEPMTMLKQSTNQVHLPVFGAKNGDQSLLGIIDQGASCARIHASVGDKDLGYSNVYASFRVRGQEEILYNSMENQQLAALSYGTTLADYDTLSIQYIPLQEDLSYMGMAATYRAYLQNKGYLQQTVASTPGLSVSLLGGTQVRESFFGLPYDSTVVTTSVTQTQTIAKELKELIGERQLLVTLLGYGNGGLANTEVGGGFTLQGDDDDWAALQEYAKNNNTVVAADYELVQFSESGSGFSTDDDVAYTLSQLDAKVRAFILNSAVENEELYWYLLSHTKQKEAMQKAIEAAKEGNFGAVSFSSLCYMAYADYQDSHHAAKSNTAEDVTALLKQCTDNGLALVATKANDYAALAADYIVETPTASSKFTFFDVEIPFYSLVFQGYKALTSPSINSAINITDAYLKAVATGQTLQFTLSDTLHDSLRFEENTAYLSSEYAAWKGDIAAMLEESLELHDKVGNQAIVRYERQGDTSITEFANGVTVYVNYAEKDQTVSDGVTVPANSFVYR